MLERGSLYLAVALDVTARLIGGWAIRGLRVRSSVLLALGMAYALRHLMHSSHAQSFAREALVLYRILVLPSSLWIVLRATLWVFN